MFYGKEDDAKERRETNCDTIINIIIYHKSSDVWNKVPFIVYAWEVTTRLSKAGFLHLFTTVFLKKHYISVIPNKSN